MLNFCDFIQVYVLPPITTLKSQRSTDKSTVEGKSLTAVILM